MEDDDNWGLQAVVRSCGGAASSSRSFSSAVASIRWGGPFFGLPLTNPPSINDDEEVGALANPHLVYLSSASTGYDVDHPLGELQELFRPSVARQQQAAATSPPQPVDKEVPEVDRTRTPTPHLFSTTSVFGSTAAGASCKQTLASPRQQQQQQPRGMGHGMGNARSKRRKNLVKKIVCHVPADALCSDMWAWRKYGQKPIKGSPFPRSYYRCSSSKGCPARKQVERSRTDPGMFVLTYTSEHNHPVPTHRSCLAGSTRHKSPQPQQQMPPPPPPLLASPPTKPSVSCSPLSSVEEDLLLPSLPPPPEDEGTCADVGPAPDSDRLLELSDGLEMDDVLGGIEELDDDEGLLISAAASLCSPPGPAPPGGVGNTWRRNHQHGHGNALPFAAASR